MSQSGDITVAPTAASSLKQNVEDSTKPQFPIGAIRKDKTSLKLAMMHIKTIMTIYMMIIVH
jgi:hypothetical protein